MSNISISLTQFLIIGIPQGFLFVLAIYIFTKTKFNMKKYLLIGSIVTVLTYLIRFLPITVGVNTMISLLALILVFMFVYKLDLPKIVNLIVSVIAIFLFIGISEFVNEIILDLLLGRVQTQALQNNGSALVKSLLWIPTNIIFAILVLVIYFIAFRKKSGKDKDGQAFEEAGK